MITNDSAVYVPAPPARAMPDTNVLHDIKGPVVIEDPLLWLWITLAALAVLTVAILLVRRYLRSAAARLIVPPVPPHVRARQKLQEALRLIDQPKAFCIVVCDTIRIYLEERFTLHAPERTTEEFLHELGDTSVLSPDQKQTLAHFLTKCDMVKFARYEPGRPELTDLHEAAVRMVAETEPLTETAAPASPTEAHKETAASIDSL